MDQANRTRAHWHRRIRRSKNAPVPSPGRNPRFRRNPPRTHRGRSKLAIAPRTPGFVIPRDFYFDTQEVKDATLSPQSRATRPLNFRIEKHICTVLDIPAALAGSKAAAHPPSPPAPGATPAPAREKLLAGATR